METQTLPALINNEQFGNLVNVPKIVDENKNQASRAVAAITAKCKDIAALDLRTIDVNIMEGKYGELDQLMIKGTNTLEQMNERRKPFTSFFDDIRGLFTTSEKQVRDALDSMKVSMNAWQAEKARRAKEAQDELDRKVAAEQEGIKVRAEKFTKYTNAILREIGQRIELLANGFYAQGLTTIDGYAKHLRDMVPMLNGPEYDKLLGEATPLSAELYNQLSSEFMQKIHAERNRLLDLVDSRKLELAKIANDSALAEQARLRIESENRDRADALAQEQKEREQSTQLTAEADSMNATFDTAANATPMVGLSKGTRRKLKYTVTEQAGMIALLQSYIKYNLPLLTIEEMNKKFSFVRTAADVRLNDGEQLEAKGLSVVEDFTTTSKRTK